MTTRKARSPIPLDVLLVCPYCDLLIDGRAVEKGRADCPRCGSTVHHHKPDSIHRTMAFSLAGLLFYVPANFLPLLTLKVIGLSDTGNVLESVVSFFSQGYFLVALAVFLTALALPLLKLLLLFLVSTSLFLGRTPSFLRPALRLLHHVDEWAMPEVYLLGILITVIKMYHMAHIEYNTGFFCFVAMTICTVGATAAADHHAFWNRIEEGASRTGDPAGEVRHA